MAGENSRQKEQRLVHQSDDFLSPQTMDPRGMPQLDPLASTQTQQNLPDRRFQEVTTPDMPWDGAHLEPGKASEGQMSDAEWMLNQVAGGTRPPTPLPIDGQSVSAATPGNPKVCQ